MYEIRIDGQLLYTTAGVDDEHIILSPTLSNTVDGAGSLEFVMPPGHALYDDIRKLKSMVTVTQDGAVIFRGRVLETEKDFYNQKTVYCEGDLSFLLDSIYAPGVYTGKVMDFFTHLIHAHNEQVDEEKQFTIGVIDAVDAATPYEGSEQVETRVYWDTSTIIHDRLLGPYGGYLRTRTENGVTYIDWLKKSGDTNSQVIEFAVNLLDLKDKIDASDVFTVLLPLGYTEMVDGAYTDPVTIASVNGGLEYIQDDAAVALYGKIWRTKSWNWIEDPALLLQKARDHLKTGIAVQTLTLKLIDMRFITGDADAIKIGQYVRILSDPHGLDITLNCTKIDIDLLNPENTTYTFGEKPRTLTENVVRTEEDVDDLTGGGRGGGGRKSIQEEAQDIIRWAKIIVDEANANINLNAGEINKIENRVSTAEIDIDGLEAQILLKASLKTVEDLTERVNSAEIEIDGANAQIVLKASQTTVDELGNRVSAAEIEIDGLNSEITLKADKVTIDSEITTINSEMTRINKYFAGSATAAKMVVTNLTALAFTFDGNAVKWSSKEVVTGVGGSLKMGNPFNVVINADTGATRAISLPYDVSVTATKDYIYYLTW